MRACRHEERPVRLVHVQRQGPQSGSEDGPWRRSEYRVDPQSGSWAMAANALGSESRIAVLLELGPEQAFLTGPAPITSVDAESSARLSTAILIAAAAERDLQRDLDRLQRCERFLVLADLLAAAGSPGEVFGGLVEHLPPILATWKALVLWRSTGAGSSVPLRTIGGDEFGLAETEWGGFMDRSLPTVALVERGIASQAEDALEAFGRTVFDRTPAVRLACSGIGDDAVAVLIERRAERQFSPQDWDLLRVTCRQAVAALDRLN